MWTLTATVADEWKDKNCNFDNNEKVCPVVGSASRGRPACPLPIISCSDSYHITTCQSDLATGDHRSSNTNRDSGISINRQLHFILKWTLTTVNPTLLVSYSSVSQNANRSSIKLKYRCNKEYIKLLLKCKDTRLSGQNLLHFCINIIINIIIWSVVLLGLSLLEKY